MAKLWAACFGVYMCNKEWLHWEHVAHNFTQASCRKVKLMVIGKAQTCGCTAGTGLGFPLYFFFSWLERLALGLLGLLDFLGLLGLLEILGLLGGTGFLWRLLLACRDRVLLSWSIFCRRSKCSLPL